jgi:hypothetical protein
MESTAERVTAEHATTKTPYGDLSDLENVQRHMGALLYSSTKDRAAAGLPVTRDGAIKLAGDMICANINGRGTLYNCDESATSC